MGPSPWPTLTNCLSYSWKAFPSRNGIFYEGGHEVWAVLYSLEIPAFNLDHPMRNVVKRTRFYLDSRKTGSFFVAIWIVVAHIILIFHENASKKVWFVRYLLLGLLPFKTGGYTCIFTFIAGITLLSGRLCSSRGY